jgi:putative transposase
MITEAKEGHPEISERDLRRMFSVSRSWYYERPRPQQRAYTDVELWNAKERIVLKFPGYGYHRVTKELQRRGWALNYKRVLRIMREESLLCQLKRRLVPATDSAHSFRSYPNLIKDVEPEGPGWIWLSDITYIRLPTAFCYLAAVLDAYPRYCVWVGLCRAGSTRALRFRHRRRRSGRGCRSRGSYIIRTRGVHYASSEYVARLQNAGALISMAAVGNHYENAKAESFFRENAEDGGGLYKGLHEV